MSLSAFVSWFRRSPQPRTIGPLPAHLRHLQPGDYAGLAIYRPRDRRNLKPELYAAIGKPFHLSYASIAEPGEPYAGQMLFQERQAGPLRSWLAEQDLEFVTVAPPTAVPAPPATVQTPARTVQDQHLRVARAS